MHATPFADDRWPHWVRWSIVAIGVMVLCSCRADTIRVDCADRSSCPTQPEAAWVSPAACPSEPCLPEDPWPDEVLCDGGDLGLPAGVRKDGAIAGLEPTEAIASYDTLNGRTLVQPTNRVCIYAPRFGAVRRVTNAVSQEQHDLVNGLRLDLALDSMGEKKHPLVSLQRLDPDANRGHQPTSLLRGRQQGGGVDAEQGLITQVGSLLPFADLQIMRTGVVDNREALLMAEATLSAITWSHDLGVQVAIENQQAHATVDRKHLAVIYRVDEPNHPQLRVIKLASEKSAQPGEIIDFAIRYDNLGDQAIHSVVIEDNLTTRLEYVPGSAKSNRKAAFSSAENDIGSLRLHWEIAEPLQPGDGDVITFQCRVR